MTDKYVSDMNPAELRAHMRRLKAMSGWHDPLSDALYAEIQRMDAAAPSASAQQAEPVHLDGRICEHCGEGNAVLTFANGRFASNCDDCCADCDYFMVERLNQLIAAPAPSASPAAPNPACSVFEDMLTSLEYTEAVYRLNVVKDSGEPSSTLENLQRVIARAKAASPAALTDEQIMKAGMNHFRRAQTAEAAMSYIAAVRECLALAAQPPAAAEASNEAAMRTALQIMANLDDRSGVLDGIDDDIKAEITDEIAVTIRAAMSAGTAPKGESNG